MRFTAGEQQGQSVQFVDKGGVSALGMQGIDWDCFEYSTEKWPEPQEPCRFDNIEDSGIDIVDGPNGGDLRVYEEEPIVIGTIVEFSGEPRRVRLSYELDWVNRFTGEEVETIDTGHDETKDAGEGRYYLWWGWSFSLEPPRDAFGVPFSLEGTVRDEISGEEALISTTLFSAPATVRRQADATIEDIDIETG